MNLFYCKECGTYSATCRASIVLTIDEVRSFGNGFRVMSEIDIYDSYLSSISDPHCRTCYNEHDKHSPVESVEVDKDKCPHRWEERQNAWVNFRRCLLCGLEQKGKVVFND